jgi:hypothetical protein
MQSELWLPHYNGLYPSLQNYSNDALPQLRWLSLNEPANGDDVFVRLSAFIDDFRIDRDRLRCLPYTFTTTYAEALFCRSNKATVDVCDRFALPNNLPPNWMFVIKPTKGDVLRKGIVKPAFMKNGGGTEVFFENGTSEYTLIDIIRW